MANKLVISVFSKDGVPKTGLSPTISIWEVTPSTHINVISSVAMTESGDGIYKYNYTSYDLLKDYVVLTDGGSTLSNEERYHYAGNEVFQEEISAQVWGEDQSTYNTSGTMGEAQGQSASILIIATEILKYQKNRMFVDSSAKTLTIYDDDGVTPLRVFDLKNDIGVGSISEIFERDPQ